MHWYLEKLSMALPHESNYGKSIKDLIHELEINHERVNASAEAGHKLTVENEKLKVETRRNWEHYQIAIQERNAFEKELRETKKSLVDQIDLVRTVKEAKEASALIYSQRETLIDAIAGKLSRTELRAMAYKMSQRT